MPSKKELCQNWKLYLVTAPDPARPFFEMVREAIEGGVDVIQLRDKKASDEELVRLGKELLKITRPKGIPLIINDRISVARLTGAEGLHLGQEDGSLKDARLILGEKAILGRSTHTPEQALAAEAEGFDYIGVGPVFQTPTKPTTAPVGLELVRFAAKNIRTPFVAIGGIDETNVREVRQAGAAAVAVVRALTKHEDPKEKAKKLKKVLEEAR